MTGAIALLLSLLITIVAAVRWVAERRRNARLATALADYKRKMAEIDERLKR